MAKMLIFFSLFVVLQTTLCSITEDSNYSVEKANEYIAENKGLVNQTYRLQYHSMAPIGWINDPNGFIQYQGEYQLFYQYNPYSATANEIHWGHSKSTDLIHWEDLPVALAPDQSYDNGGVFSGSSIEIDGKLYVMYTGNTDNSQVQCIAVSEDDITFEKIPENPVLKASDLPSNAQPQDFRDPKVFKRGDLYYVVTVSKTTENTGQVLLYQSSDFISWEFKSILLQGTSEQGNMWECPDLFELDGKDVLILSAIQMPAVGDDFQNIDTVLAFVGTVDWDEGKFSVETVKELDHGLDFYATQTLLDDQGRRVMIAWMNMWGRSYPTAELNQGWAGAMILPRVLQIKDNYLVQTPVAEIASAYDPVTTITSYTVKDESVTFDGVTGNVAELELELDLTECQLFTIEVRKGDHETTVISYDTSTEKLAFNRENSGVNISGNENPPLHARQVKVALEENKLSLQVFLDKSSVEVFANNGSESLTSTIYPTEENANGIQFSAQGKAVIDYLSFSQIVMSK